MNIEIKKGESTQCWRIMTCIRQAIKEYELEEIVKADKQPFGEVEVLKQIATKSFTIEIKPNVVLDDVSKSQQCDHEFDVERPVCIKCGWNRYYSKPTY